MGAGLDAPGSVDNKVAAARQLGDRIEIIFLGFVYLPAPVRGVRTVGKTAVESLLDRPLLADTFNDIGIDAQL
jgi:hypothetical protein